MVELKRYISSEQEVRAAQAPTTRATLKSTQSVLQQHLGFQVDLTSHDKVVFWQKARIEAEDQRQVTSQNELARVIIERGLPLQIVSDLGELEGLAVREQNNFRIAVSFDIGGTFAFIPPTDSQSREILSQASIFLFRNLARIAIESHARPVRIVADETILSYLRQEMIKTIGSLAQGERAQDIQNLATEMEEKTSDIGSLSLECKGANVELCLNDQPLWRLTHVVNEELKALLETSVEQRFIDQMSDWNSTWFTSPERWQHVDNHDFIGLDFAQDLLTVRANFPFIEIPDDPKEILNLYLNGEIAREALSNMLGRSDLTIQEIPQEEKKEGSSSEENKKTKVILNRNKNNKKKKSNPSLPPRQAFPRHQTPVREPAPPEPLPEIPVRYGGPEPLVFETAEIARLRRQSEIRARREAERERIRALRKAEIDEDKAFRETLWETIRERKRTSSQPSPAPTDPATTIDQIVAMAFGDEAPIEQSKPIRFDEIINLADQTLREINPYAYTFTEEILWLTGEEFKMMFAGMPETELESFRNFLLSNMGAENPAKRVNLQEAAFVDYSFPHPTLCLSADTYRLLDDPDLGVRNQAEIRLAIDLVENAIAASPTLRNYLRTDLLMEIITEGLAEKGETWPQIYPQLNPDLLKNGLEAIWTIIIEDESTEIEAKGLQLVAKTKFRTKEGEKSEFLPVAGEDLDDSLVRYLTAKIIGRMISEMVDSYPQDQQAEVEARYFAHLAQLENEPDEFTKVEEFLKNVGIEGYEDALSHYQKSNIPQLFQEAKAKNPQLIYNLG